MDMPNHTTTHSTPSFWKGIRATISWEATMWSQFTGTCSGDEFARKWEMSCLGTGVSSVCGHCLEISLALLNE